MGISQKDIWAKITSKSLVMSKILVDLFSDINEDGSNEEKISIIIQNMEEPFSALKALSL